jgi:hypothetical protein
MGSRQLAPAVAAADISSSFNQLSPLGPPRRRPRSTAERVVCRHLREDTRRRREDTRRRRAWEGSELADHELRRIAERAWHQFLKGGLANLRRK